MNKNASAYTGNDLRLIRLALSKKHNVRITIPKMAAALGIPFYTYRDYEKDKRRIPKSIENLIKLLNYEHPWV